MNIRTVKITLIPVDSEHHTKNDTWQVMRDLNYHATRCLNKSYQTHYANYALEQGLGVDLKNDAVQEKGNSVQNSGYKATKEFTQLSSHIRVAIAAKTYKDFSNDKKELMGLKRNTRNYKLNGSIPISKVVLTAIKEVNGKHFIDMKLNDQKPYRFEIFYGRDRSNVRGAIKYASTDLKALTGDGSFVVKSKSIFLNLPIKYQDTVTSGAKVMGIDLGVAVPIVCATEDGAYQTIGDGEYIRSIRLAIQSKRRNLQKAQKESKGGRGRNSKMTKSDDFGSYEKNVFKTINHKLSKQVIDFALKQDVKVIKMEKLKGILKDEDGSLENKFLGKIWTYNQLQTMITNKATKYGIEVVMVDPKYTSQTCSTCGHKDKAARVSQSSYICTNKLCTDHGKEKNADVNAAINIAKK